MGIELFLITLIAITVATISLLLINYWDRLYNNREETYTLGNDEEVTNNNESDYLGGDISYDSENRIAYVNDEIINEITNDHNFNPVYPGHEPILEGQVGTYFGVRIMENGDTARRYIPNGVYDTSTEEECTNCEKGIIGYKNGKNKYGCIHCGNKM